MRWVVGERRETMLGPSLGLLTSVYSFDKYIFSL